MAENPNDTTQVRDAKAARTGKFADAGPLRSGESQAEYDARVRTSAVPTAAAAPTPAHPNALASESEVRRRDAREQTTPAGVAGRIIAAETDAVPGPVTLHLMDADERTVVDRVQVKVRPFVFELDGNRYQQVREQPDGSWVYRHIPK